MKTSVINQHFSKEEQDLIVKALLENEYPRISKLVLTMNTLLALKKVRVKRQLTYNVVKYWLKTNYPEVYEEVKRRNSTMQKYDKNKEKRSLKDYMVFR